MHTYVVNLARSADRRAHIMAELRKTRISYEIVAAVDARDLDFGDTRVIDPAFAEASADRPGVVGCALSHLEIYRRVLDGGLEEACILEDDVLLPPDLDVLAEAITPHMSGAEVVLLNFHSYRPCRLTKAGAAQLPSSRLLAQVLHEGDAGSTGCYLITREACARMVKTFLPARTVADDWALFHREGAIDRLRCVIPMQVVQSPALRSTMSHQEPGSLTASIREAIAGSRVPVLRQALALRRRRHLQRYAIGQTVFVEDVTADPPQPGEHRLSRHLLGEAKRKPG